MNTTASHKTLISEIDRLQPIVEILRRSSTDRQKEEVLDQLDLVNGFIERSSPLQTFLADLSLDGRVIVKSIIAIEQGPLVFQGLERDEVTQKGMRRMIELLLPAEAFYRDMGGIVGYHASVLALIAEKLGLRRGSHIECVYSKPAGVDLLGESPELSGMLRAGIESLPRLAVIYPVGGAGDRLQLRDEATGTFLPVARLKMCGIYLLEWLIRDLQAKELLFYKLTGKMAITPIAMMTSHEKGNHEHILAMCEEKNWFGRPKDSFRFFTQPLVPVISEEGEWCLSAPFKLIVKPGGHGVMWKLAKEEGVFDWLLQQGRDKVLVRQINNPLAATNTGLLSFLGVGCSKGKSFGFASCRRLLNTAEGMNVLSERKADDGYACAITNIEYTDFSKKGIEDIPDKPGSPYSAFPANTNILFADLKAVESALAACPIPGMILNMKNAVESLDVQGRLRSVVAGRLESTMQNIADAITDVFPHHIGTAEQSLLRTYVTYNNRQHTISVTKKSHVPGESIVETPEGCFYDLQKNAHELLSIYCEVKMPSFPEAGAFPEHSLPFFVYFHPALGPLYDIIAAKIHGGILHEGAEWIIEATEVDICGVDLEGSLIIRAADPALLGKCALKNVGVVNDGVAGVSRGLWKGDMERKESLEIIIHGNGEFHAENVVFRGACRIEVSDGSRIEAIGKGDAFELVETKIASPSWRWDYFFSEDNKVSLKKALL